MADITPTSGKAWRQPREEGVVVPLPSGKAARLRPVALDVLILNGSLPDLLTPLAAEMLFSEKDIAEIQSAAELAEGTARLVNHVCRAAMMEPKIVDEPQAEDEITLEDVSFNDKMTIFQLAILPAESLRKFRDEQAAGVDTVPDGDGDGEPTE